MVRLVFLVPAVAALCACSAPPPVEENAIIAFEDSRFADWGYDPLFAHFDQLWWIEIQEAPGPPWAEDREFFVPYAQQLLHGIVSTCELGEAIFQHGNHGVATLHIDDVDLSERKVGCIRSFESRGVLVNEPTYWEGLPPSLR